MTARKYPLCLAPEHPDGISCLTEVSEVFPDTPNAVRAIVAKLHDGRYAVWSALPSAEACSPAVMCATEEEARAEQARLVSDLLQYSRPEAVA